MVAPLLFRHVWCLKSFGVSLLYVGAFAPHLKWLICRGAEPRRRLVTNVAGCLKRDSTEARRDARGLGSADRRELGPTQGQHSTRPLARAQRTLFRALALPSPCLPMLRTSGQSAKKKHKSLQIADVGRTSAGPSMRLCTRHAQKQSLCPRPPQVFQQALPLAPTLRYFLSPSLCLCRRKPILGARQRNWDPCRAQCDTVQSPCRIAAKPGSDPQGP